MNRPLQTLTLLLAMSAMLAACAPVPVKPHIDTIDGVRILAIPADLSIAYIKANGNPERLCAPRFGDVSDTRSEDIGFSIPMTAGSTGVDAGNAVGAISLGGRDPAVLLVRELLFRACELSMNLNLDYEAAMQVYNSFLKASLEIVRLQGQATGTLATSSQAPTLNLPSKAKPSPLASATSASNAYSSSTGTAAPETDSGTESNSNLENSEPSADSFFNNFNK